MDPVLLSKLADYGFTPQQPPKQPFPLLILACVHIGWEVFYSILFYAIWGSSTEVKL